VPYREVAHTPVKLPPREYHPDYTRGPVPEEILIPQVY
jgi:hypothetical protein